MSNIRTVDSHGKPAIGTKVIYRWGRWLNETNQQTGKVGYVAPLDDSEGKALIGFSEEPGARRAAWVCSGWELVSENPVIDDLTDAQKQALTDKALDSAKKRGYCGETKKILSDLGLPTERTPEVKKVVVEIEYTVKNNDPFRFSVLNGTYGDVTIQSVKRHRS